MSLSHEDLLLLILSDGRWHSLHEILRRHPMMVHSRAAGLRDKGFTVEHRCVGKGATGSEYRLRSLSGRAETRAGAKGRLGSPAEPFLPMGQTHERGTPARPLSDRPLVEPGETRDQEPNTAGSPGVSRTADAGVEQEGPLSPGSTSGLVPGGASVATPWGVPPAAPPAAPSWREDTRESMAGQLSMEEVA